MKRPRCSAARARGVSLIEVIVALVVISGFGAALFVWAGQTLQTVIRATQVQQQTEIERNITEIAYTLNPTLRPTGELVTATHRYRWRADLAAGPADQVRLIVGVSPWQAALYRVRFTVTEVGGNDEPLAAERLVAGYRQVRVRQVGPPGFGGSTIAPPP